MLLRHLDLEWDLLAGGEYHQHSAPNDSRARTEALTSTKGKKVATPRFSKYSLVRKVTLYVPTGTLGAGSIKLGQRPSLSVILRAPFDRSALGV